MFAKLKKLKSLFTKIRSFLVTFYRLPSRVAALEREVRDLQKVHQDIQRMDSKLDLAFLEKKPLEHRES